MGELGTAQPPQDHGPYLRRATLDGGLRVAVRGLRGGDRDQLQDGFGQLSDETRFRRFLTAKSRLSDRELDLLFGPGPDERIVLVLVWPRTSREDILLGVARATPLPGQADTADVAVTVADELHGRGAGRLLMSALADLARPRGVTQFTACLLPSNTASARLLTGVGEVVDDRIASGVRELTVRLVPAC